MNSPEVGTTKKLAPGDMILGRSRVAFPDEAITGLAVEGDKMADRGRRPLPPLEDPSAPMANFRWMALLQALP